MANLYLLKYNNYINRILKVESTLSAYVPYQISKQENVNFWQGDGLTTSIVADYDETQYTDYVVETDGDGNIESRWFIIDKQRSSTGQATLSLRRDVMAENKTAIENATGYIYRGSVKESNRLIFNQEGNSYNQIKTNEYLLKDDTGSPWIVGYLADNFTENGDVNISLAADKAYSETYTDAAAVEAAYPGTSLTAAQSVPTSLLSISDLKFTAGYGTGNQITFTFLSGRVSSAQGTATSAWSMKLTSGNVSNASTVISANTPGDSAIKTALASDLSVAEIPYSKIGTVIRVGTSASNYTYYKLSLTGQTSQSKTAVAAGDAVSALVKTTAQTVIDAGYATGDTTLINPRISYSQIYRTLEWVNVTVDNDATIAGTVTKVNTAPYYMFAMPYNDIKFTIDGKTYTSNRNTAFAMANAIIEQLNAFVYDMQLLPYYPGESDFASEILLDEVSANNYTIVYEDDTPKTFIYWCGNASFTKKITCSIPLETGYVKVQSETQIARICSPNYASIYEFSPAKNGGVVYFTVDCTYRPWQPYIHVAPDWGGLYGINFDDPRGLICGGDFSLDIATDAWAQYQANNKNYQLMFDRQIQTMDLKQGIDATNSWVNGISKAVGAVTGIAAGLSSGNYAYAASSGLSLGSIGLGISQGYELRANERSQAIDMYNYELGNVKARPDTLTKVSALNQNNKLFPVVEIYNASADEVAALQKQILYSGMKVGVVALIGDYLGTASPFIQARLIRIDIEDEPHVANAIAAELQRGYYWY